MVADVVFCVGVVGDGRCDVGVGDRCSGGGGGVAGVGGGGGGWGGGGGVDRCCLCLW